MQAGLARSTAAAERIIKTKHKHLEKIQNKFPSQQRRIVQQINLSDAIDLCLDDDTKLIIEGNSANNFK